MLLPPALWRELHLYTQPPEFANRFGGPLKIVRIFCPLKNTEPRGRALTRVDNTDCLRHVVPLRVIQSASTV